LFKTIIIGVVCLFLGNQIAWAYSHALAARGGDQVLYEDMLRIMHKRVDDHQETKGPETQDSVIHDLYADERVDRIDMDGSGPLNEAFNDLIIACDVRRMIDRLNDVLRSTGGMIGIAYVDADAPKEDELSQRALALFGNNNERNVIGHPGGMSITLIARLRPGMSREDVIIEILATLVHEIMGFSMDGMEAFKREDPKTPDEANRIAESFEKERRRAERLILVAKPTRLAQEAVLAGSIDTAKGAIDIDRDGEDLRIISRLPDHEITREFLKSDVSQRADEISSAEADFGHYKAEDDYDRCNNMIAEFANVTPSTVKDITAISENKTVDLKDLTIVRTRLDNPWVVLKLLAMENDEYAAHMQERPIFVVKWRDNYFVSQGKHRCAAAWLSGEKSIQARIIEITDHEAVETFERNLRPKLDQACPVKGAGFFILNWLKEDLKPSQLTEPDYTVAAESILSNPMLGRNTLAGRLRNLNFTPDRTGDWQWQGRDLASEDPFSLKTGDENLAPLFNTLRGLSAKFPGLTPQCIAVADKMRGLRKDEVAYIVNHNPRFRNNFKLLTFHTGPYSLESSVEQVLNSLHEYVINEALAEYEDVSFIADGTIAVWVSSEEGTKVPQQALVYLEKALTFIKDLSNSNYALMKTYAKQITIKSEGGKNRIGSVSIIKPGEICLYFDPHKPTDSLSLEDGAAVIMHETSHLQDEASGFESACPGRGVQGLPRGIAMSDLCSGDFVLHHLSELRAYLTEAKLSALGSSSNCVSLMQEAVQNAKRLERALRYARRHEYLTDEGEERLREDRRTLTLLEQLNQGGYADGFSAREMLLTNALLEADDDSLMPEEDVGSPGTDTFVKAVTGLDYLCEDTAQENLEMGLHAKYLQAILELYRDRIFEEGQEIVFVDQCFRNYPEAQQQIAKMLTEESGVRIVKSEKAVGLATTQDGKQANRVIVTPIPLDVEGEDLACRVVKVSENIDLAHFPALIGLCRSALADSEEGLRDYGSLLVNGNDLPQAVIEELRKPNGLASIILSDMELNRVSPDEMEHLINEYIVLAGNA